MVKERDDAVNSNQTRARGDRKSGHVMQITIKQMFDNITLDHRSQPNEYTYLGGFKNWIDNQHNTEIQIKLKWSGSYLFYQSIYSAN